MSLMRTLIQSFLNYSVNPRQYRVAIALNVVIVIGLAAHLTVIHGWREAPGAVVLGLVLYTFGEYAYHRWIAHGYLERYMDVHHDEPDRLFTTPWFAAPLFLLLVWPGFALISSPAFASHLFLGAALIHNYGDLQHYLQHRTVRGRFLRAHHLHHHRNTTANFGLTTRLWDYLFGTLRKEPFNDAR